MSKPIIAIVGKPNVGKSRFFNYVIGQRISIVEDTPGVTRDRVYGETSWRDREFTLIDTGGIEPESNDVIISQMKRQAEIAIELADVILFMTDIRQGVTSADQEIAIMLRKTNKPVILVCNKSDNYGEPPAELYEFYNLGLGQPHPISAANAIGIGDLLDEIYYKLPPQDEFDENDERIKVAIIGKPNVGKSSLLNTILNEERSIVSDIAGTTRDAIDSEFQNEFGKYIFIDTAGIRKKSKVNESIEKFSVMRTLLAIERADVCLVLIDALEGVTDQDAKILGEAHEAGKYAPIMFISAKTGQRVNKIFELINNVAKENSKRISTAVINEVINEAIAVVQPPTDKGKRLKILYGTQASTKPPTFIIFVNNKSIFHFSYQRYLINCFRNNFGFEGTPIRIIIREKGEE